MSIPSITDRLEAATAKAENASQIMHNVANGGPSVEVPTESGPVPSIQRWYADLNDRTSGAVGQVQALVDKAVLSYPDYAAASAAAATLPDGQIVESPNVDGNLRKYVVSGNALADLGAAETYLSGETLAALPSWDEIPQVLGKGTTAGVNAQAQTLANRVEWLRERAHFIRDYASVGSAISAAIDSGFTLYAQESVVVRVPSDAPNIQSVLDAIAPLSSAAIVTILIESGYELQSGALVRDGNFSKFEIASEDAIVQVSDDFVGVGTDQALLCAISAVAPKWNTFVDMRGKGGHGLQMLDGSDIFVHPAKGVTGAYGLGDNLTAGLFLSRSTASAESAKFAGNGRNTWITVGSTAFLQSSDLKDAREIGCYASRSSTVAISSANLSGAGNVGLWALGALIHAGTANISNCGAYAIYAQRASNVHAVNANLQNAGTYGITCREGSTVNAIDSNASGAGTYGFHVSDGGHIVRTGAAGTQNLQRANSWFPGGCITDDSVSPKTMPALIYADGSAIISNDLNTITETGFYRANGTTTLNLPTQEFTWAIHHITLTGTSAVQSAMLTSANKVAYRRKVSSVWQPWAFLAFAP